MQKPKDKDVKLYTFRLPLTAKEKKKISFFKIIFIRTN